MSGVQGWTVFAFARRPNDLKICYWLLAEAFSVFVLLTKTRKVIFYVTSCLECRFAALHLNGGQNLCMVVESQTCQHNKNIAQWHIVLVKTYTIFPGSRLPYSVRFRVILNPEFHSFVILPATKRILWSYLSISYNHFSTSPICLPESCAVEKTLLNKVKSNTS